MHRLRLISAIAGALIAGLAVTTIASAGATSADGAIVFVSNRAAGESELYVVDRDGSSLRRLTFNELRERQPVWSPDRSRIAFAGLSGGNWDIYTVDAAGGELQRLTEDPERDDYPRWTSDGRITFQRGPFVCPCAAWIMDADGSGQAQIPIEGDVLTPEPSRRGQKLAYASNKDGRWAIYVAHLDGQGEQRITDGPPGFGDFHPRWSSSGNDIVFLRDPNGLDNDVFVVRANGADLRRLTQTPDRIEFWPSWNGEDEIVFTGSYPDGRLRLHAVSVSTGTEAELATWPQAPVADDFDDGVLDRSIWHRIQDPGSSIAEEEGRLVASIAAGSTPGGPWNQINTHYGSSCSLPSDYDLEVEFELLQWQPLGFYASLNAFFANAGISRQASPWGQQYVGWSDANGNGIPSDDTSGSFRLVRSGPITNAYARRSSGPDWTLVFSGPSAAGESVFGMGLTAPGDWYQGHAASVAFDNFRLNSGVLTCPSWWNDSGADAG
jgi:Tol biopolymer transport system component